MYDFGLGKLFSGIGASPLITVSQLAEADLKSAIGSSNLTSAANVYMENVNFQLDALIVRPKSFIDTEDSSRILKTAPVIEHLAHTSIEAVKDTLVSTICERTQDLSVWALMPLSGNLKALSTRLSAIDRLAGQRKMNETSDAFKGVKDLAHDTEMLANFIRRQSLMIDGEPSPLQLLKNLSGAELKDHIFGKLRETAQLAVAGPHVSDQISENKLLIELGLQKFVTEVPTEEQAARVHEVREFTLYPNRDNQSPLYILQSGFDSQSSHVQAHSYAVEEWMFRLNSRWSA